jgi:hypothetical protein
MPDTPKWRSVLREPNAIGWIGFFLLVIAIGLATLFFGSSDNPGPAKVPTTQASK